jgi:hypothetical protein
VARFCEHGNEPSGYITYFMEQITSLNLIVTQLFKKLPVFYGTREFTNVSIRGHPETLCNVS